MYVKFFILQELMVCCVLHARIFTFVNITIFCPLEHWKVTVCVNECLFIKTGNRESRFCYYNASTCLVHHKTTAGKFTH